MRFHSHHRSNHHAAQSPTEDGSFLFSGRHRGPRGFGHFKGSFGGGFGEGDSFRTGRKLASADLQLLILALMAEKPCHGYELIKALEERSGGFYAPSPGMVYPALTYLEEIGYATVTPDGAKKLYQITDEGREHLQNNREAADGMLSQLQQIGEKMVRFRRAFNENGDAEDDASSSSEVRQARYELRRALAQKKHCNPEEGRRIAEILRKATGEILGNG